MNSLTKQSFVFKAVGADSGEPMPECTTTRSDSFSSNRPHLQYEYSKQITCYRSKSPSEGSEAVECSSAAPSISRICCCATNQTATSMCPLSNNDCQSAGKMFDLTTGRCLSPTSDCPRGSFKTIGSSPQLCQECPLAKYGNASGQTSEDDACFECSAGRFGTKAGQSSESDGCAQCPSWGAMTPANSIKCFGKPLTGWLWAKKQSCSQACVDDLRADPTSCQEERLHALVNVAQFKGAIAANIADRGNASLTSSCASYQVRTYPDEYPPYQDLDPYIYKENEWPCIIPPHRDVSGSKCTSGSENHNVLCCCATSTEDAATQCPLSSADCNNKTMWDPTTSRCLNASTGVCPAGTWGSTRGGRLACEPCPRGSFGTRSGSTSKQEGCEDGCPVGKYGSAEGQTSEADACSDCPSYGKETNANAAHCTGQAQIGWIWAQSAGMSCDAVCSADLRENTTCQATRLNTVVNQARFRGVNDAIGADIGAGAKLECNTFQAGDCVGPAGFGGGYGSSLLPCQLMFSTAPSKFEYNEDALQGDSPLPCTTAALTDTNGQATPQYASSCSASHPSIRRLCCCIKPGEDAPTMCPVEANDCGIGTVWNNNLCMPCPLGTRYVHATASTPSKCVLCSAGKSSRSRGTTECQTCQPGTFSQSAGMSACSECSSRRYGEGYQPRTSDLDCALCAAGLTSPAASTSRTNCTCQCAQGTIQGTGEAIDTCIACKDATYSPLNQHGGRVECRSCPREGATCGDGMLTILKDYWYDSVVAMTPDATGKLGIGPTTKMYKCAKRDACLVNRTAVPQIVRCHENHTGVMCAKCFSRHVECGRAGSSLPGVVGVKDCKPPGYFQRGSDWMYFATIARHCVRCPAGSAAASAYVITIALILVFSLSLVLVVIHR